MAQHIKMAAMGNKASDISRTIHICYTMRVFFWRHIILRINFHLREVHETGGRVDFSQMKINSRYDKTTEKYTHCVTYLSYVRNFFKTRKDFRVVLCSFRLPIHVHSRRHTAWRAVTHSRNPYHTPRITCMFDTEELFFRITRCDNEVIKLDVQHVHMIKYIIIWMRIFSPSDWLRNVQ